MQFRSKDTLFWVGIRYPVSYFKRRGVLLREKRRRKFLRIEWLQVFRLLAKADELDWQPEFLLDRDYHPALARAVELGDNEAGERDGLVKLARLVERVHAGGGVEHEQGFMRRAGELAAHDAVNLLQLLHQVVLGVQPASGIDD